MAAVASRVKAAGLRRVASAVVVLAALGFFVLTGGWRMLAFSVAGWFENALGMFGEFEPAHRMHSFAFSLVIWPAIVGLLLQLRSPRKHLAGQLMVLVPWVALLLAFALTDFWAPLPIVAIIGGLTLLAALLHPAGRELVTSISLARVSRVMLALVIVAAVPLLAFAATQVGLQTGAIEPTGHDHGAAGEHQEVHEAHVEHGHFAITVAFAFVVLGVGLVASLRQAGWWLPAWIAAGLAAFFGLASAAYPAAASTVDTLWAVAAIAWGVAFVGAAVRAESADEPSPYGSREPRAPAED